MTKLMTVMRIWFSSAGHQIHSNDIWLYKPEQQVYQHVYNLDLISGCHFRADTASFIKLILIDGAAPVCGKLLKPNISSEGVPSSEKVLRNKRTTATWELYPVLFGITYVDVFTAGVGWVSVKRLGELRPANITVCGVSFCFQVLLIKHECETYGMTYE